MTLTVWAVADQQHCCDMALDPPPDHSRQSKRLEELPQHCSRDEGTYFAGVITILRKAT
jgi:hypothetical protein